MIIELLRVVEVDGRLVKSGQYTVGGEITEKEFKKFYASWFRVVSDDVQVQQPQDAESLKAMLAEVEDWTEFSPDDLQEFCGILGIETKATKHATLVDKIQEALA